MLEGTPQGPGAPFTASRSMRFRTLDEEEPGPLWKSHFEGLWPGYREWFLSEGPAGRPTLGETLRALRAHMPELLPLHDRLATLVPGDEAIPRFLGLWCPAPFLSNCSQLARGGPDPVLVRNYDYRPDLCEGTLLHTRWNGRPVIASSDCTWGVLDGMNGDGLAVSLSFGGRRVVGEGFGIPVVLRYLLETCASVPEAVQTLRRIPVHMAYNVTLVDAAGEARTAFLSPDRPVAVRDDAVAANHQERVEWPEHALGTRSEERETALRALRADAAADADRLAAAFLAPPLYATDFARGWGTLYTTVYRPLAGTATVLWPDGAWTLGFADFPAREREVVYAG